MAAPWKDPDELGNVKAPCLSGTPELRLLVASMSLRHSVRALVLDEVDRVLLCRHALKGLRTAVWAAPGGGIEPGEAPFTALRRELWEEVGLNVDTDPPHV